MGAFVQGLGFKPCVRSITWMPTARRAQRTHVWLEGLGEWTWPGQGGAAAEVLPPPWVPTLPPRREPAIGAHAISASAQPVSWRQERARMLLIGVLLSALASVCAALALHGQLGLARVAELWQARSQAPALRTVTGVSPTQSLPTLTPVSEDAGGQLDRHRELPLARAARRGRILPRVPAGRLCGQRQPLPGAVPADGQRRSPTAPSCSSACRANWTA